MTTLFRNLKRVWQLLVVVLLAGWYSHGQAQQAEFIWSEQDDYSSRIVISKYENGLWQRPQIVIEDQDMNMLPALGADSKNRKLAVWSVIKGGRSLLKYSVNRNGSWLAPQVLHDQMRTNLAAVMVFDDKDVGWIFWSANNGDDDDDIYMSRFTANSWSAPQRVNEDNDLPDILPEAGLDDAGNIWVSWQSLTEQGYVERSKSFSQANGRIQAANAMSVSQIKQLKTRATQENQLQPPAFFKSLSRASFHFPENKQQPSRFVQGSLQP